MAEISNTDFVNSFLLAARKRKLSVVVTYGEQVGARAVMRLVSNVGEAGTKAVLAWLQGQGAQPIVEIPTAPEEVS